MCCGYYYIQLLANCEWYFYFGNKLDFLSITDQKGGYQQKQSYQRGMLSHVCVLTGKQKCNIDMCVCTYIYSCFYFVFFIIIMYFLVLKATEAVFFCFLNCHVNPVGDHICFLISDTSGSVSYVFSSLDVNRSERLLPAEAGGLPARWLQKSKPKQLLRFKCGYRFCHL